MASNFTMNQLKWSNITIQLKEFLDNYQLPQIIAVEDGIYGCTNDETFSSGDILKLHTVITERKIRCKDSLGRIVNVPFHTTDKICLIQGEKAYRLDYLLSLKPLPVILIPVQSLEVGNVNADDVLEIVDDRNDDLHQNSDSDDDNYEYVCDSDTIDEVKLKTNTGEVFSYSKTLNGQFRPEYGSNVAFLNQIIPNQCGDVSPVSFKIVDDATFSMLTCETVYDEDIIIASQITEADNNSGIIKTDSADIFSIRSNLDLMVTVNNGTLANDAIYAKISQGLHAFPHLEDEFCNKRNSVIPFQCSTTKFTCYENAQTHSNATGFDSLKESKPVIPVRYGSLLDELPSPTQNKYKEQPGIDRLSKPKIKSPKPCLSPTSLPQVTLLNPYSFLYEIVANSSNSATDHPSHYNKLRKPANNISASSNQNSAEINDALLNNSLNVDPYSASLIPDKCIQPTQMTHDTSVNAESHLAQTYGEQKAQTIDGVKLCGVPLRRTDENTNDDSFMLTKEVNELSVDEVSGLLRLLNMEKQIKSFRDNQIDGYLLKQLDKEDLRDLGLNKFESKKLLVFIQHGWRPNLSPS